MDLICLSLSLSFSYQGQVSSVGLKNKKGKHELIKDL